MTNKNIPNTGIVTSTKLQDDEIDIKLLFHTLIRNKRLIAFLTSGSVLLSGIYAFTTKKTWEGQFEIVLAQKGSPLSKGMALLDANPRLASLIQAGSSSGGSSSLKTEVKILRSPSILMPVYKFVKDSKEKSGEDTSKWTFEKWRRNSLGVNLQKGTSVLNLSYKDSSEELIKPVLNKISTAYQNYSGRDRTRGLEQGLEFMKKQILKYRTKSKESKRIAQEFNSKYDLGNVIFNPRSEEDKQQKPILMNIDRVRINQANYIRNIDEKLKQYNNISNDPELLRSFANTFKKLKEKNPVSLEIDALDQRLSILRSSFKENDPSIQLILRKRSELIKTLGKQLFSYLKAEKAVALANKKAAERPMEVLIKYQELLSKSIRDENTLQKLETEKLVLALEKARRQDPWELITNPTVLDSPVAPRKKMIVLGGSFVGLVLGCATAIVYERKKNLIFSLDELQKKIDRPLLAVLNLNDKEDLKEKIDLLVKGPLSCEKGEKIALIYTDSLSMENVNNLKINLSNSLLNGQLISTNNLLVAQECNKQFIVASLGVSSRDSINKLKDKIVLQDANTIGWILLNYV